MEDRNYGHRMTAKERVNTLASEESSGGCRLEAQQKECLNVTGVRGKSCQNERTLTPEEFQVRRLKTPYDGSVSELHAWLVDSLAPTGSQPGGEEERVEKGCPHVEPMKPRRGGGTL